MPPAAALQLALTALQNGELPKAEAMLSRLEREHPHDPNVLHLLGLVRRRQGRNEDAVTLFERALAARDAQPHIHSNLATALAALGQTDRAEQSYRRALEIDPNFADARYNLGLLQLDQARWTEAKASLEYVARLQPSNARAHDAVAIALRELGETEASLEAAKRAAALAPQAPNIHHNLGQACMATGRYADAEQAYTRALALNPQLDASWIGLGHAYRGQGRAAEAKAAYQKAVETNPSNVDAHRLLNEMVWQTGETNRYLQSFRQTLHERKSDNRLRLAYANELLKIGEHEEARRELTQAVDAGSDDGATLDAMARTFSMAGNFDEAGPFHRRALEAAPENVAFVQNFAESLLKARDHGTAHTVTKTGLERFPLEQGLLALHTTAQRLHGDESYGHLANYDALPRVLDIEPPPGFADIESFCAHLATALDRLHATKAHPTDQTLRGGTQTFGALFVVQDPAIQAFVVQLRKALASMIADLPDDRHHPFLRRKSGTFDFSGSWSVKLSSGGFHTNHFHPKGWISSAFYVDVPPVAAAPGSQEGWFKMGETNLELGEREIIHRLVQPKVGRLVLFPSYFWHGTVPFNAPSPRTTIAFDVVPK